MPSETQPEVVRSFLAQLEAALHDVPREVGGEIVAGITEELAGLDAATAAARIEELGDPVFIAAEALAGAGAPTEVTTRLRDPLWYIVVASLLVAIGGIVVPIVGWIIGITLVCLSKTWRTWEKWVATLLPVAVVVLAAVVLFGIRGGFAGATSMSVGYTPGSEPSPNPALPSVTDLAFSSLSLMALISVVVGIWLLWRALRPFEKRNPRR